LGQLDALIFSGGIGENDSLIRKNVCIGLAHLGIVIDDQKNQATSYQPFAIQREAEPVKVLVIPTNEELEIAQQTLALIENIK
jgi:acetate kinase